jgi:hypothetical protein
MKDKKNPGGQAMNPGMRRIVLILLLLISPAGAVYIEDSTTVLPADGQAELLFSIASKEEITNVTVTIDTELGIVQEEVKTLEVYPEKVKTSEGEEKTKSEKITGGSAETALDINNSLHVVPLDSSSKDSAGSEANKLTVERESKYSVHTAKQTLNYYSLPFEVIGPGSQFAPFVKEKQEFRFTLLIKDASESLKIPVRVRYTQSGKEYEEILHIGAVILELAPAPAPEPEKKSPSGFSQPTATALVLIAAALAVLFLRKKRN